MWQQSNPLSIKITLGRCLQLNPEKMFQWVYTFISLKALEFICSFSALVLSLSLLDSGSSNFCKRVVFSALLFPSTVSNDTFLLVHKVLEILII